MAMKYEGGNSYRIMVFCLPKQFFQYSMCVSIFLEEQDVIINLSVTQIHLLSLNLLMNDCNFFSDLNCNFKRKGKKVCFEYSILADFV